MTSRKSVFSCLLPVVLGTALTEASLAADNVTEIHTTRVPAIPFSYTVDDFTYYWGMGDNELMTGFSTPDERFAYAMSANRVEVRRDDIADLVTGEPCGIFVERLADGDQSQSLAADYPSDGSGTGNCDIAAMLASRVINRGALDLFSNVLPDAKNIERLDYIFDYGLLAPLSASAMTQAGHVGSEKSSNNPVKIAAILSLDSFGNPASYGPLLLIDQRGCADPQLCYSTTPLRHQYTFLQNEFRSPQGFPTETERTVENVGMAFISASRLGLRAGQRYYGFSFFSDDVDSDVHVLTDPSTFPNDTSDDFIVLGDDADLYGGLSGYFAAESLSVASGSVFLDENGDGQPSDNEAGISDIGIRVYADTNNNGVFDSLTDMPISDPIDSDLNGNFVLPGLPDGTFFVVIEETDPDIPPGLVVTPGSNPHMLSINGNDPSDVYFAFVDVNNGSGGDTSGGSDSGASDAGGSDTGGSATAGGDTGSGDTGGVTGGSTDGGATGGSTDGATGGATDGATGGATDGATGGATDGATGGSTDGGGQPGITDPINDPLTMANPDVFEVNAGESASVDVLANDIDGAGGGLVIVSISESPNATITEQNGLITYTPNFGFYGTDTFLYVIQDADGTQVTGTVTATVVRFSDLNNNGQNDFVECNCDSLTLETGVRGSGVGSVAILSASLLSLLIFTRAYRNRRRLKGGA